MTKLAGELLPLLKEHMTEDQITTMSAAIGDLVLLHMLETFQAHLEKRQDQLIEYMIGLGLDVDITKLIAVKHAEVWTQ